MRRVESKLTNYQVISQARETGKVRGFFARRGSDAMHARAAAIHDQACQQLEGRRAGTQIRGYLAALRGMIHGSKV